VASVSPLQQRPTPVAAEPSRRAPRRNMPLLGVGIVLVVVGALASAALRSGAAERIPVLVVARPVSAGAVITEADLREVELSPAPGVATVPASQRSEIVGRRAALPLSEGMVLSDGALASGMRLAEGEAVVPLSLAQGRVPAEVGPGDRVAVMIAGSTTPGSDGSGEGPAALAEGRVLSVRSDATDATVVSLVVDQDSAATVMSAAGAGAVGLVLLAGE